MNSAVLSLFIAMTALGIAVATVVLWNTRGEVMTFPPDGLRYGSRRDMELTRRAERRCRRFRGRVRAIWRRSLVILKFKQGT
jgi:hypothetical protein